MLILLIGPRGSGKTAIGRRLAAARGIGFIDLDDRVLSCFDEPSVRAVWDAHGEAAWRSAEAAAVQTLLGEPDGPGRIVALGGGTPMVEEARVAIAAARDEGRARIVYLKCSVPVLAGRLAAASGDRPSLTGADVAGEVRVVLAAREPVYRSLADVVYDNDQADAATASAALERALFGSDSRSESGSSPG